MWKKSQVDEEYSVQRPRSEGGWRQGVYKIMNYKKYMSTKPPIYRSSWEYSLMYLCDTNEFIVRWGSEIIEIPYINPIDGNQHRYFADFYIEFKDKHGKYIKWVVEVKPASKLNPPKQQRRTKTWAYQMNEYAINKAKWAYAEAYCKNKGWEFKIMTEEQIRNMTGQR